MTTNVVVSRITLFSAKMDETAEFYKAVGIEVKKSVIGWGPYYSYLEVIKNHEQNLVFEICSLRPGTAVSPQNFSFEVEDLAGAIKRLMEIGAPLTGPAILKRRPELRDRCSRAGFRDPDGRVVSLYQREKTESA